MLTLTEYHLACVLYRFAANFRSKDTVRRSHRAHHLNPTQNGLVLEYRHLFQRFVTYDDGSLVEIFDQTI